VLDVGMAAFRKEKFRAYEILGSALDPAAQLTTTTLTVKELLAPISREDIKTVRCLGLNYADHAEEAKMRLPAAPILFYKPVSSLIGPLSNIAIPKAAQPVEDHLPDYEVELVVIIGKPAKNVSQADALNYVLGYTAANDISFRLHQKTTSQWGFSKGFDDTTPLGPCIVSATVIPDPQQIPLACTVNDQVLQDGTTADQIFSISRTISFLSQGTTLEPGSIILTGTPKGVGFVKNPPVYLKHGDRVDTWIGNGIGTLVSWVHEDGREDDRAKL